MATKSTNHAERHGQWGKNISDGVVIGETWASAIEKAINYGPAIAALLGLSSAGAWFAHYIDGLHEYGWGIYPFVGAVLALIIAITFAAAAFALAQWSRARSSSDRIPTQSSSEYLIDPWLPDGQRTSLRVLIDQSNWRADALRKENVYEVKATFLDAKKTAVQLVIIFQKWTLERGARISTDNRLERYSTAEEAMTPRYAIYTVHGIKSPCIVDIEFQSGVSTSEVGDEPNSASPDTASPP